MLDCGQTHTETNNEFMTEICKYKWTFTFGNYFKQCHCTKQYCLRH